MHAEPTSVKSPFHTVVTDTQSLSPTEKKVGQVFLQISKLEKITDTIQEWGCFLLTVLDTYKYPIIMSIATIAISAFCPPLGFTIGGVGLTIGLGGLGGALVGYAADTASGAIKDQISGTTTQEKPSIWLSKRLDVALQEIGEKATPLQAAAKIGSYYEVKRLLETPEGFASINSPAVKGKTPLQFAIESGRTALIKLLLESGADINAAFQTAVDSGNPEIVHLVLDNNPPPSVLVIATAVKDFTLPTPTRLENMGLRESPHVKIEAMLEEALFSDASITELVEGGMETIDTVLTATPKNHSHLLNACLVKAMRTNNLDLSIKITTLQSKDSGNRVTHSKYSLKLIDPKKYPQDDDLLKAINKAPNNKKILKDLTQVVKSGDFTGFKTEIRTGQAEGLQFLEHELTSLIKACLSCTIFEEKTITMDEKINFIQFLIFKGLADESIDISQADHMLINLYKHTQQDTPLLQQVDFQKICKTVLGMNFSSAIKSVQGELTGMLINSKGPNIPGAIGVIVHFEGSETTKAMAQETPDEIAAYQKALQEEKERLLVYAKAFGNPQEIQVEYDEQTKADQKVSIQKEKAGKASSIEIEVLPDAIKPLAPSPSEKEIRMQGLIAFARAGDKTAFSKEELQGLSRDEWIALTNAAMEATNDLDKAKEKALFIYLVNQGKQTKIFDQIDVNDFIRKSLEAGFTRADFQELCEDLLEEIMGDAAVEIYDLVQNNQIREAVTKIIQFPGTTTDPKLNQIERNALLDYAKAIPGMDELVRKEYDRQTKTPPSSGESFWPFS